MTLVQEWQYPEGYLDFISGLHPDPPQTFASTEGQHGYETARVIFSYLPPFFTEDPYLRDLIWAMAIELDAVRAALDDILASFFIEMSPSWGIAEWEEFTSRIVAPSVLTEVQRRALVKAELNAEQRLLEDFVKFTAEFNDVDPSLVTITEDFANYIVEITVQGSLSASQEAEFEFAIREILPAHLDVDFTYGGFIAGVNLAGDVV